MKSSKGDNAHTLVPVRTSDGPRMIPCRIDRSRRLRRMCLQFECHEYVTLKLPGRTSEKSGLLFIQQHADWICGILDSPPAATSLRQYLARHPRLAVEGSWHKLQLQFVPTTSCYDVDSEKHVIRLALQRDCPVDEQMKMQLREIAREYLPKRVKFLEPRVGVKAHGTTVRDQKSRWGSCSETSSLSLNWRLILLSPNLQDHVVLHELAHIRHFDHSRDFHSFLKALDRKSKEHAQRLHQQAKIVFALGR